MKTLFSCCSSGVGAGTSSELCVTVMPLLLCIRKSPSPRNSVQREYPETSTTHNCILFQKSRWLNLMTNESDSQETYGALDLGGASTQITFVPQNQTVESPRNALYFRLYGKNYNVYTHSFLCYGKDQALLQKLAKDIQASITESRPAFLTSGLPAPTSCCFLFLL